MNKSEELRIEAQQEENDLVYLGKIKKVFREERSTTQEKPAIADNGCCAMPIYTTGFLSKSLYG